ncbi:MAG: oligosaccharide flippase family protein [Flavobacteriaceae bacterium]|nr:oligosaccharide flippase family protein [Flavobacteriaceae bacterium]
MGQGKGILKNTLIYAIGNFGSKLLVFLLLPLYSFYLTKDEFGIYDLIIVTINLLVPIITLQAPESVYRWLIEAKDNVHQQGKIIFNGLIIVTLVALGFFAIFYVATFFFNFQYTWYFALLLLFSCYVPFFQKVLRGLGKTKEFAVSGLIYTSLFLVFTLFFVFYLDLGIASLLLAAIIASFLVILYLLKNINVGKVFARNNFEYPLVQEMVKYSAPLVPNSISWWLINASDKYLILLLLNVESNGIYAVSTRFPAIVTLVNSIFLLAWQDHSINAEDDKKSVQFISRLFNVYVTFELSLVIFLISISYFLIKFFIDPAYIESWKYIPLLFLGVAFQAFSAYFGVLFQKAKQTKGIFVSSFIGGIVNFSISLLLLDKIGLYAPAIGTFISFLLVYLYRRKLSSKFYTVETNNLKFILLTLIAIGFIALGSFNIFWLNLLLIVIASVMFVGLN